MPKFKMQVRLEGTFKTRGDEREFRRLLEAALTPVIHNLTTQFDGSLGLKGVEVGPVKQDGESD